MIIVHKSQTHKEMFFIAFARDEKRVPKSNFLLNFPNDAFPLFLSILVSCLWESSGLTDWRYEVPQGCLFCLKCCEDRTFLFPWFLSSYDVLVVTLRWFLLQERWWLFAHSFICVLVILCKSSVAKFASLPLLSLSFFSFISFVLFSPVSHLRLVSSRFQACSFIKNTNDEEKKAEPPSSSSRLTSREEERTFYFFT